MQFCWHSNQILPHGIRGTQYWRRINFNKSRVLCCNWWQGCLWKIFPLIKKLKLAEENVFFKSFSLGRHFNIKVVLWLNSKSQWWRRNTFKSQVFLCISFGIYQFQTNSFCTIESCTIKLARKTGRKSWFLNTYTHTCIHMYFQRNYWEINSFGFIFHDFTAFFLVSFLNLKA